MLNTSQIFQRYEDIRPRMPSVKTARAFQDITSLMDIANEGTAFVFDAFGVLNVGETLIEGADQRLDQLRAKGCDIRILTNAASYDRTGAFNKFKKLGLTIKDHEIITSRDATLEALTPCLWGVISAPEDGLTDLGMDYVRLEDIAGDYDRVDGFLFLSSSGWTSARQHLLQQSLLARKRPVLIANADLAAPRDDGFSAEPGHFGHLLVDQGIEVRFFGKPYREVYDLVEQTLPDTRPDQIVMCGDTLHTDIMGAAARKWRTVLVTQDGLFSGHDTEAYCKQSGLFPDWRLSRI